MGCGETNMKGPTKLPWFPKVQSNIFWLFGSFQMLSLRLPHRNLWTYNIYIYTYIYVIYIYICIYIYDINTFIKLHHLCHALTPVFHSSAWCWNMQIGSRLWLICLYYYVQCVDICHNIKHITKHKENRMMWKNAGLLWWCPSPQETHSEMIAFPNGFLPKVDYLGRKENRFKFQFLHSNTTRHWAISIYGTTVEFSR